MKLFNESFLVSGDSTGEVTFWDTVHGTQLQTFNQLKADILTIEVNPKHGFVYASGVDSRVLSIQLTKQKSAQKWVVQNVFRGQSHDIRALLLQDADHKLLSAGVTTDVCVYPLTNGRLPD